MPNFTLLDTGRPEIAHLLGAMLQARVAVDRRSWANPDVLADPRARKRDRRIDMAVRQDSYRLADEQRPTILVACSKCDWRAAYPRVELVASYGEGCAMPSLLNKLAKPGCVRRGNQWDACGAYYVEPIDRPK